MKTWMRRRGDRVKNTTGKYTRHTGTVESDVYQRTVDYLDEWNNGYHVMLDSEELVTVRWEQVMVRQAREAPAVPRRLRDGLNLAAKSRCWNGRTTGEGRSVRRSLTL